LEVKSLEYATIEGFLADLKKFGGGDDETIKVVKLKRIEQRNRTIEEFMQEFRRAARESKYERRPLIEKFKQDMNRVIQQRLIELEHQP